MKHSDEEAVRWFREAAAGGLADAKGILGSVYLIGQGVTVDYGLALKYNEKAAHHGSAIGQCNLGKMYELGNGVKQDLNAAQEWYRRAAKQGLAGGEYQLGRFLIDHGGMSRGPMRATNSRKRGSGSCYTWARAETRTGKQRSVG